MTLLNFGDSVSLFSAWVFIIIACMSLFYSAVIYLVRMKMIRKRVAGRYYDWLGPNVLYGSLLVAVGINFGLRIAGLQESSGG